MNLKKKNPELQYGNFFKLKILIKVIFSTVERFELKFRQMLVVHCVEKHINIRWQNRIDKMSKQHFRMPTNRSIKREKELEEGYEVLL